jgi:hypothetical protein
LGSPSLIIISYSRRPKARARRRAALL